VEETKEPQKKKEKKFDLLELVDHPNDITFTDPSASMKMQEKIELGDDEIFDFEHNRTLNDDSRPSIVSDLLDGRRQSILSDQQIKRLKF